MNRRHLTCAAKKSLPWFLAAAVFWLVSIVVDNNFDLAKFVEYIKSIGTSKQLAAIFFCAFLEAVFPITFYWPGTMILLGILLFGDGVNDVALIFIVWMGINCGFATTYLSTKFIFVPIFARNGRQPLHHDFIETTGAKFEAHRVFWAIFCSLQPTFSSALVAYIAYKGYRPSKTIAIMSGASLIYLFIYILLLKIVTIPYSAAQENHSIIIVGLLVVWGLWCAVQCFVKRDD